MKIRDLIEEVSYSLQNGERDIPSPTDPDEDWLEGTNARLLQVSQRHLSPGTCPFLVA